MRNVYRKYGVLSAALLIAVAIAGCKERHEPNDRVVKIRCGDQTVNADPVKGAVPAVIYLCDDDKVTWNANGHAFKVEFKEDSPFSDDDKVFDNTHAQSKKVKHLGDWAVFPYKITVDGKVFDPHVIGGGGNYTSN